MACRTFKCSAVARVALAASALLFTCCLAAMTARTDPGMRVRAASGQSVLAEPPPHVVAGGEAREETDLDVGVDPLADLVTELEELQILAEAHGRGRLLLHDGDVVSGRIVAEGIDVAPGATIYVDGEVTIATTAESTFRGTFVPLPVAAPEDALETVAFDPDGVLDFEGLVGEALAAVSPSSIMPSCPSVSTFTGANGSAPAKLSILFLANGLYSAALAGAPGGADPCNAPAGAQLAGPAAPPVGAKSVRAIGGNGGNGMDVTIRTKQNVTITIDAALCNSRGADGGAATAQGGLGNPCSCGGDAYARGGRGGDAGDLKIAAWSIVWGAGGTLTINPGGNGGNATASGGPGGDCDVCGGKGGRGGHAVAIGGKAGSRGTISIKAASTMVPAPNVVLLALTAMTPAASGGTSTATAGPGGLGGPCPDDCGFKGGDGGDGGNAYARGGEAAPGTVLASYVNQVRTGSRHSNGGNGGAASATGGAGGAGVEGGDCLCSQPMIAGAGGNGGKGGSASARGADGGLARGGPASTAVNIPVSGNGGNATATCGVGGDGGDGGDCKLDQPEVCTPGPGGAPGPGGTCDAIAGKRGSALSGATPGLNGVALPPNEVTCLPGIPGAQGLLRCEPTATCCVPHPAPGCGDPACQGLVCAAVPFCCQVAWDELCAEQASLFCPDCGGVPSNCCFAHPGVGCDQPACTQAVCAIDPFCCGTAWDPVCAATAAEVCPVCGGGGPGSCCSPHPTPGCADPTCQGAVCGFLPFCCQSTWDVQCASLASELCPQCAPAANE